MLELLLVFSIFMWGWFVFHISLKGVYLIELRHHSLGTGKGVYKNKIKESTEQILEKYNK